MKKKINHYSFGQMTIAGKEFTSDVIIKADGRTQANWRRRKGHNLVPEDISELLESAPQKLIIGTGHDGLMSVSPSVVELCRERGVKVAAFPTAVAVDRFNEAVEGSHSVAACFHLTC